MQTEQLLSADALTAAEDAIRAFPVSREVLHCGNVFSASPFAIYSTCPLCKTRIKLRSFTASTEIEDVFDAVFEWMSQPGAKETAAVRMSEIAADTD